MAMNRAPIDTALNVCILQFAIAAGGEEGLHRLWQVLSEELSIGMAQTGLTELSSAQLTR